MVLHDDKLMQEVLLLHSVMQKDFYEKLSTSFNLKYRLPFEHICGDKVSGFGLLLLGEGWSKCTSAAEADIYLIFTAGLKACSTLLSS